MIQASKDEVSIKYNKLHADPAQGKSLDIIMKKVKHRLVENMSSSTADALGLSRAILCNDTLVKKLRELESVETTYRGLVDHARRLLKAFYALIQIYKAFGDVFAGIGVREPQPRASEAFRAFGDYHRTMEKNGIHTIKTIKPILSDLGTYLTKAIPDTKLTIRKYADAKFEYLSYCLKVKEMDDEEYSYAALQEPLYRVETGNYEYRLILRCRQEARARFAQLRSDVLVKLELLDNKHVQDLVEQLQRFVGAFATFHAQSRDLLAANTLFPIEMDLARSAFQYNTTNTLQGEEIVDGEDEDDELIQTGEEALDVEESKKNEWPAEGQLIEALTSQLGCSTPGDTTTTTTHQTSSTSESITDFLAELSSLQMNEPPSSNNSSSNLQNQAQHQPLLSSPNLVSMTPTTSSGETQQQQQPPTAQLIGLD